MRREVFIPYEFGLSGQPFKSFDATATKAGRLEKLLKLKEADVILRVCRHYLQNFVPRLSENENEYWIISCFPGTDHALVRVSIWFPEVFNIHFGQHYYNRSDELYCMVFTHQEYLDNAAKQQLLKRVRGLEFHPEYRFVTGISGQLAAFMPLTSYFRFVEDERIFEGVRAHNYELTLKGRTPFKKGHNFGFVRYLFEH